VENRVIRFADRRAAYGFVAELRRLYDLERWAELWVYATGDGILVDIPVREMSADPLTTLADRYGGWAPVAEADLRALRADVAAAELDRRVAARRLGTPGRTPGSAGRNLGPVTQALHPSRHQPPPAVRGARGEP
jgi:hypothetical protein